MPQAVDEAAFEVDHIIARKHHGQTVAGNLCLSCFYYNSFKGSDLSSLDIVTRKITPLFNPRRHRWTRHFRWDRAFLFGRTPIGRVTIALLHINDEYRVELRELLIKEGAFPAFQRIRPPVSRPPRSVLFLVDKRELTLISVSAVAPTIARNKGRKAEWGRVTALAQSGHSESPRGPR